MIKLYYQLKILIYFEFKTFAIISDIFALFHRTSQRESLKNCNGKLQVIQYEIYIEYNMKRNTCTFALNGEIDDVRLTYARVLWVSSNRILCN